jgi:hypothetical protein
MGKPAREPQTSASKLNYLQAISTPLPGTNNSFLASVASALELEFKHFATFDARQQQLARDAGLKIIVPSA